VFPFISSPSVKRASWKELLADPGENDHTVQIYQDEHFLGDAVSHFAAEGVLRNEAVILVATPAHWRKISAYVAAKGLEPEALSRRGQLTLLDADEILPVLMSGNMPNEKLFRSLAEETIEKARAGGKYPRVRWWGEIVNALYANSNPRASARLEELCTEVARKNSTPIFCSFLMDKFDPRIYDSAFGALCRTHSHVIPAQDYVRHRRAVVRAIHDVIGAVQGALLRSLMSWPGALAVMPSSQAMLLWVKDTMPERFEQVLARARQCDLELEPVAGT
jgi:hypothetical protein